MSVYMPLDCDGFAAALADYLEGDAPDAVRAAVEAHAAECADCGQLLADLQGIRHDAANLPTLVPSRDLWSGIAERIDARVVPLERHAPRTIVPVRRAWAQPAIAAAALVIATAGVTYWGTRTHYEQPTSIAARTGTVTPASSETTATTQAPRQVAEANPAPRSGNDGTAPSLGVARAQHSGSRPDGAPEGSAPRTRATGSARAQLASANTLMTETEPVYDREITKLRTIMKTRRSQLDPKTVAVLEQSLAVIDSAIAQSRAALAKDPASGFLAEQLNHSLEKKVELLRTAAMLPART